MKVRLCSLDNRYNCKVTVKTKIVQEVGVFYHVSMNEAKSVIEYGVTRVNLFRGLGYACCLLKIPVSASVTSFYTYGHILVLL